MTINSSLHIMPRC